MIKKIKMKYHNVMARYHLAMANRYERRHNVAAEIDHLVSRWHHSALR